MLPADELSAAVREVSVYARVAPDGAPVRAQEELYREAVDAVDASAARELHFKPLASPDRRGRT